ncbi:DUF6445 family protein [Shewanella polaris]|uniref:2OG-Fe(II) oxygenase n=1 Tax=Shewanella polaris TaxID=2588449 RepID=A0A4Y5YH33_9GAMM|nr:DUF6445 family protein [Shewanella polaris]QDE31819.1 hypothetical protein FH971_13125 [Shewanella polaris]
MSASETTTPIVEVNNIAPQVQYIGQQQTPIIVIDNFAGDITKLIDIAINDSQFSQDQGSYYPGQRTALPRQYIIDVINSVFQLIYDVYRIPTQLRLKPQQCVYSLIDKQPESLAPLQCLPHFDTPSPHYFAILHYLNDGPHGNTGFFRHNLSGYERITAENIDHYFAKAQPFLDDKKHTTPSYFVASDEHYSLYHQIEYRPNRLVIYPGNLLHSTLVNPQTDIDATPSSGRLTANIFINFQ